VPLLIDGSLPVCARHSGIYYAPVEGHLETYREYVRQLPMDDGPEIFGMHENANISFQAQETFNIVKTCLSIQPRTAGGKEGDKSPDEIAQVRCGAVLCCAVRCCAVLCCAVLCCAVLCCAVLCCAVLCCAVLCGRVLRLSAC
jgi:hypothetical protein